MNETINTIGVATVAAIIVICYLIGMIVKASPLQDKWIPIVCGVCGGAIGALALLFGMPEFPAQDYFTAATAWPLPGIIPRHWQRSRTTANTGRCTRLWAALSPRYLITIPVR